MKERGICLLEPLTVVSIIVALILLLLFIGIPIKPLRFIGQGITKLLIGAVLLFFLNTLGNHYEIHVPINIITTTVTGFLGIPGLIALVAVQTLIL
jgi:inhibitor of the pro-sigma K processing machinery